MASNSDKESKIIKPTSSEMIKLIKLITMSDNIYKEIISENEKVTDKPQISCQTIPHLDEYYHVMGFSDDPKAEETDKIKRLLSIADDNILAQSDLVDIYYQKGDYSEALKIGEIHYQSRHQPLNRMFNFHLRSYTASICFRIHYMYDQGCLGKINKCKSFEWALRSALYTGSKSSSLNGINFYNIGIYFMNGDLGEISYVRAMKWFKLAIIFNNEYSEYAMGRLYYMGLGVEQDLNESYYWYVRSKYHGFNKAVDMISTMLEKHPNIDKSKANAWLESINKKK